jgi:hypothetical protein
MEFADPVSPSSTLGSESAKDAVNDVDRRARELSEQLSALTGIDVVVLPSGLETPLRSLEIDSLVFIDFLGRTEIMYGFAWDEDTLPEAFETLLEMARWMLADPAGGGAVGGGAL